MDTILVSELPLREGYAGPSTRLGESSATALGFGDLPLLGIPLPILAPACEPLRDRSGNNSLLPESDLLSDFSSISMEPFWNLLLIPPYLKKACFLLTA